MSLLTAEDVTIAKTMLENHVKFCNVQKATSDKVTGMKKLRISNMNNVKYSATRGYKKSAHGATELIRTMEAKRFSILYNKKESVFGCGVCSSLNCGEYTTRLTAMEESHKTMDSNIGIVIKGNKDSLEILDSIVNASGELLVVIVSTTIPASAFAFFGISSAAPSVAPSVGPVILTDANAGELSKQDHTRILALIQEELKKYNFKSNKTELVAANDSKHSWDVNVDYRLPPNRQLMHDLHAYLAPKVVGTSEFYEARKKTNSWSRKADRENDHFDYRKLTYHTFKAEIDVKVGKSCNGLLQKEAMSEGKSEDNMPGVSSNRAIRTYNHFLAVVDDFMCNCMDFNSHQMLKRSFGRDTVLAVLPRLTSLLPHWAFRDKFQ
ncbi:hypothetical protein PHYBLDRAFT_144756 [Phycomyces blakesleeanus NRRL 1555(-)]|uniref:Uncharacterized protein n=1 Tax=Phycomyces blakesleeanus (strain ATCC 8743b / DSM 1359 / FGSC 10004 / NBRC 33097 / NRRL 1555) TaxID=763407 RepID=A0A167MWR0_PHYB8|nr:hypothetical protein PHYBLDRAFT_144756 [Phycomyces blakesleeanus NRRL 1555(-)]OAD74309.1 hypothetical protein PHYBLDRAFT_144756 [Phycomyces blakesleeanus NRRL 1555(-)]|eukprot:XP_018292349.1 hypothetical protein PHYBLDRAFT_144756 [Phycomyces blakesleeanus NRRL 1555(-)]